jgi:Fe-S-cluster-containing dehydrogenase component
MIPPMEPPKDEPMDAGVPRRRFLQQAAKGAAGAAMCAFAAACQRAGFTAEEFLQQHFRELTPADKETVIRRLEREHSERFGKPCTVSAKPALPGVVFGYGLDLSRCVGCRRCVYACVKENNQSRDPQIHWIRVLAMKKETGVDVYESTAYYNPKTVPEEGFFYMPTACQQCRKPPCVKACPVKATWQEADGIVVVDYNWCIGCRYCMAACPYGARHFNWRDPVVPAEDYNPDTHYLGNRIRMRGVVEKCTFCIQRVREGKYPACVEICPTGARKFGNLLDEDSEIRYIIKNKRVFVWKEDLGTQPKFYYFYGV